MCNARLYKFSNDLGTALKTRQPHNEVKHSQKPIFGTLYAESQRLEQFIGAMTRFSRDNFSALADKVDFSRYHTLCDIGGASGLLSTLLQKSTRRSAAYHSIAGSRAARNQGYRAFV